MVSHWLFDKNLAYIVLVVGKVGRPQKIETLRRLRTKVQPDLAGPRQGDCLMLYDLTGRVHQLQQELSRLVGVELEEQAIGGRVEECDN